MTEPAGSKLASQKPANDADSLDALRSLLLGKEQKQIEQINDRIEDLALRSADMAEVLPESLQLSGDQGSALTDALEKPVTTCIQRSIERDPDSFADALYPVMGPAIRQSISATLKELVHNINRTLEHSLSPQGIKWRFEAMRSGVPFPEVVLRHTLSYRVEQVFLIQPDSGLLMQHVQDELATNADADAVSGMLTAIAQFVRDAFKAGDDEGLETVEIGDHTVLLVHGPSAYLACVIRGIPPGEIRQHGQEVLEELHRRFSRPLSEFDGDTSTLSATAPLLQTCLRSEQKAGDKKKGIAPATLIILLVLVGAIAWGLWQWWTAMQTAEALRAEQQALVDELRAQPGLVVTETRFGDVLRIEGLRDPLAVSPESLRAETNLNAEQVQLTFKPYLDVSTAFAEQRARARLQPPAEVKMKLDADGTLRVSGKAPNRWVERASLLAAAVPGVNAYDDSALLSYDQHSLNEAKRSLQPPETVNMKVKQGLLRIRGRAPLTWIENTRASADQLPHIKQLDMQVEPTELAELLSMQQQIDGSQLMFFEGNLLDASQQQLADELAAPLHELMALAQRLGYSTRVVITGRTDGIGSLAYNEQLALARALIVRDELVRRGFPPGAFTVQALPGQPGLNDPSLRRAELRVLIDGLSTDIH